MRKELHPCSRPLVGTWDLPRATHFAPLDNDVSLKQSQVMRSLDPMSCPPINLLYPSSKIGPRWNGEIGGHSITSRMSFALCLLSHNNSIGLFGMHRLVGTRRCLSSLTNARRITRPSRFAIQFILYSQYNNL